MGEIGLICTSNATLLMPNGCNSLINRFCNRVAAWDRSPVNCSQTCSTVWRAAATELSNSSKLVPSSLRLSSSIATRSEWAITSAKVGPYLRQACFNFTSRRSILFKRPGSTSRSSPYCCSSRPASSTWIRALLIISNRGCSSGSHSTMSSSTRSAWPNRSAAAGASSSP